ncbi:MAG: ester cyclase [Chloroflexi bacterium]|nr:ester cyclase [Chloroflexota bacterium]
MSAQDNAKIAQAIYESFNSREIERGLAQYASDVEIVNMPLGLTLHGHDGYRQFIQGWTGAFPDGKVEVTHMVADDNGVVTEFRGRGKHNGPLAGPAGIIPATGRAIDVAFCEVLEIKNGKIVKDRLYFDAATMMGQLGLMGQ